MPDARGSGPAAILNLRYEGGLYPPDFLGVGQLVLEGRHVRAQRIELLKEILCLVRTESRPDMAGRDELASCVFAEHDRPDRFLGNRGRNEPGDDERAMLRAFDLEPGLDASGTVRSRGPLRDDTFEAEAAGVSEDRIAVAPEMLAESDAAVVAIRGKELAERRLPLGEWRIPQIEAIDEEKIERIEGEIASTAPQGFDQSPEARNAGLGLGNDFPVDQPRFQGQGGGRLGDRFEPLGPVEALPGAHGDAAVGDAELHAVAVIFDLVEPVRAGRCLLHGGRQAGCDERTGARRVSHWAGRQD